MSFSGKTAIGGVGLAAAAGRLAAVCAVPVLCALWARRRLLTWGATAEETTQAYPGDELVPDADSSVFTMATTLPAPPEKVWPWLVQMGYGRAGWYSWDRLDNGGKPSADRIVPEWQRVQVGQRLIEARDGRSWFTVERVEPNRTLALRTTIELPSGRSFDPKSGPPRAYADGVWSFNLQPAPGGQTRLIARTRGKTRPRAPLRPFGLVVGDPAHFIMQTRQFHGLRTRVGAQA
jgi:proline iminopeptidase